MKILSFLTVIFLLTAGYKPADLPKSEKLPAENQNVVCVERDSVVKYSEDPIILKTCTYGKFKSKTTGQADYKGRYSYKYQLYENNKEIKNEEMFGKNQARLVRIVNQKIQENFKTLTKDSAVNDCIPKKAKLRDFQINEMGIEFMDNELVFNLSLMLGSACFNIDVITIKIKLEEAEPYFKK